MDGQRSDSARRFARQLGLKYVHDQRGGYSRRKRGRGFVYLDPENRPVRNRQVISRIEALVIPPAWEEVWICAHINGHLQVTGRDQKRRKQYRYHAKWSESRNLDKFKRLREFGEVLPKIRARVRRDLARRGLPREKVLAAVVQIMERTGMRIGNREYSRTNKSYGLTTIHNHHAQVKGAKVRFRFRGKSGVERDILLKDARLTNIVKRCQHLPGEELFAYEGEDGLVHDIGSSDVNAYLKEISGMEITAKQFRTWGGTLRAIEVLSEMGPCESDTQRARKIREAAVIKQVAETLGNTVAVCRKYYVNPCVFEADRCGKIPSRKSAERFLLELLNPRRQSP